MVKDKGSIEVAQYHRISNSKGAINNKQRRPAKGGAKGGCGH